MIEQGIIPIITGYIASTPDGVTSTLGRGGSDYTAAILGAVLLADDVWIWSDVDGVMSADPRVVPEARTIPVLTYREIAELAYFGAKVVHPKTIRPVIDSQIGLRVCNTFNPAHPGTRVIAENLDNNGEKRIIQDSTIKAVTAIRGQSLITVEGRGMLGVPGVAARTFGAVAVTGTSVPMITQASSEQSICFAVPIETVGRVIASLESAFALELERKDIDRVWGTGEITIITIVGAGMRNTPGIAGRIFTALGANKINVIAIAQGSSEVAVSLVVDAADADAGLRAVHALIVDRSVRP
jgi:aspartate kinase